MDREEDVFCALAATVMQTGRYITDRANTLVRELASELTTPVDEDDEGDDGGDGERFFRTVLVVEVMTMGTPYTEGVEGFGEEYEAERLRAVVLAEASHEVDDPWVYPSTQQLCAGTGTAAELGEPHEFFADPDSIGRIDGQCRQLASDPVHTRAGAVSIDRPRS